MRKQHVNTRKYSEPIKLITYEEVFKNGILVGTKKDVKLLWASIMQKNFNLSSTNERAEDFSLSVVIPQPDFKIDISKTKVLIDERLYIIKQINFNFIDRGTIQLECQFEMNQEEDVGSNKFDYKIGFKMYG